jgi:hypothetical protein
VERLRRLDHRRDGAPDQLVIGTLTWGIGAISGYRDEMTS